MFVQVTTNERRYFEKLSILKKKQLGFLQLSIEIGLVTSCFLRLP